MKTLLEDMWDRWTCQNWATVPVPRCWSLSPPRGRWCQRSRSAAAGAARAGGGGGWQPGPCTVLYCTALYCTVLYCTVLYCTVLYCMHVTSPVPTSALIPATRSSTTTTTVPMPPHWPLVTCTHFTVQLNTQYNNTIQTLSYISDIICGIITDWCSMQPSSVVCVRCGRAALRHCAATSHCPGHSLSALMSSLCGWLGETNPSLVQGGNMKAALCSPYPSLTGNQLSIVSSDNTGNSPTHSAWCRIIFHQNLRCNIVTMMKIMQIGLCVGRIRWKFDFLKIHFSSDFSLEGHLLWSIIY